ncbi:MAG TPA: hypothetical protein VJ801_08200 [Polyangia bacterium]|nr:hypothetical protein [Polyangia bacterium]
MRNIRISSILPVSYRDELERIVFFNPEQSRVATPLVAAVGRYGVPTISEETDCLRFHLRGFREIQSLFALDESEAPAVLVGAVMFVREQEDRMLLLHLAVHERYTARGDRVGAWVALRLVAAVRSACMRTKGIRSLCILYPGEKSIPIGTVE